MQTTQFPAPHPCSCRLCDSARLRPFKRSNLAGGDRRPEEFQISSADFGRTPELVKCLDCGLVQISGTIDAVQYYVEMRDPGYEATREHRLLQARRLLSVHLPDAAGRRLLDVGAGSGVLVQEAIVAGWRAEGIEPSSWLADRARHWGLPVRTGVLPNPALVPPYDVVCLIDVIEHVDNPRSLVAEVDGVLKPGGRVLVVTPDIRSLAARIMGRRWWHYRTAHLTYFDRHTLNALLAQKGYRCETITRPSWYFPMSYLIERLTRYISPLRHVRFPVFLLKLTVRLNLFDSIAATYRKPA